MITAVFLQHSFNNIIPVNFYFCKAKTITLQIHERCQAKKTKLYVLLLSIK